MCSVTAMRPAQTRAFRILHDQRCCSAGLLALPRRADPSHPIPLRMRSATTALDGDSPAFPLVRACVEPPAGIEPATPSLPSMVGPFGGQRGTSLRSTEPQVAGRIEDREMGCCEAVCGAAAGKSLARIQVGCPVVAGLRDVHVRGSGNGSKPSSSWSELLGQRSDSNRHLPITSRTLTLRLDPPRPILAAQVRARFHLMPSRSAWYQRLGCHRGCHHPA
jgi:hypothetical protein